LKVSDDAESVHSFHAIIAAKKNPFGIQTDEETDEDTDGNTDAAPEGVVDQDEQAGSASHVDSTESPPRLMPISREQSFGEFVMDVFMYEKESGENLRGCARLDTGMTLNAVSYPMARLLGYPIEEYQGDPCVVADGSFYHPIGQVTIPFKFVSFRTAQTWRLQFIVFPEGSPFDICLGRRFINLANLLKRNPEALPVHFVDLRSGKCLFYQR
jgi:hypothetical protein